MQTDTVQDEQFFTPDWARECEGWTINFINANVWRTQPERDFDDLYQECYVRFLVCCKRYKVKTAEHFMSLYMISCINEIHWFASKRTRRSQFEHDNDVLVGRVREDDVEKVMSLCEDPILRVLWQNIVEPKIRVRLHPGQTRRQQLKVLAGRDDVLDYVKWKLGVGKDGKRVTDHESRRVRCGAPDSEPQEQVPAPSRTPLPA